MCSFVHDLRALKPRALVLFELTSKTLDKNRMGQTGYRRYEKFNPVTGRARI